MPLDVRSGQSGNGPAIHHCPLTHPCAPALLTLSWCECIKEAPRSVAFTVMSRRCGAVKTSSPCQTARWWIIHVAAAKLDTFHVLTRLLTLRRPDRQRRKNTDTSAQNIYSTEAHQCEKSRGRCATIHANTRWQTPLNSESCHPSTQSRFIPRCGWECWHESLIYPRNIRQVSGTLGRLGHKIRALAGPF